MLGGKIKPKVGRKVMFVERLTREDLADYIQKVTLKNETYDYFKICCVNNWNTRLGECECRQVVFTVEKEGNITERETDIEDFSFEHSHNLFMLNHFGDEYLNYLRFRVDEEIISEPAKAHFIKRYTSTLAFIKSKQEAIEKVRNPPKPTLEDFM